MEEARENHDDRMDDDLLFDLAVECETLLAALHAQSMGENGGDGLSKVVAEYQQRFAIWTAHIGVFATKSQSLDRRLRSHGEIKDVVARLLDMVRRSAHGAMQPYQHGIDHGKLEKEQNDALGTLERALRQLNSLSATIRRSSRARSDAKLDKFAAMTDLEPFTSTASAAIDSLYPFASKPLRDYLKTTVIHRYSSIRFEKNRREKLASRRPAQSSKHLPPIPELDAGHTVNIDTEPQSTLDVSNMPTPVYGHEGQPLVAETLPAALTASQSGLSTLDSRPVREWLNVRFDSTDRQPPTPSSQRNKGTSSIHVGQRTYPPLPAEGTTNIGVCEWCGEEVDKRLMRDADWRRHMDHDLRPFVCMAEECEHDHPKYPIFVDWVFHMARHHKARWYQNVYPDFDWICLFCKDTLRLFTDPDKLHLHLTTNHKPHVTDERIQEISQQCKVERKRAVDQCLLCGLTVEEPEVPETSRGLKRQKSHLTEQTPKTPRKALIMSHPDPHTEKESSTESSDDSDDPNQARRDTSRNITMTRHIADHLQGLMLLTLRLEYLQQEQNPENQDYEGDSDSVDIGDTSSSFRDSKHPDDASQARSRDQEEWEVGPLDSYDDPDHNSEMISSDEILVPDTVAPLPDLQMHYSPAADQFLQELIQSGAYQGHVKAQNEEQLKMGEAKNKSPETAEDVLSSFMFQLDLWDWDQSDQYLAVGIDLGTLFTKVSWAYSRTPNDIHQIDMWPGAYQQGLGFGEAQGVPTVLSPRAQRRRNFEPKFWKTTEDNPIRFLSRVLFETFELDTGALVGPLHTRIYQDVMHELDISNFTPVQAVAQYLKDLWLHVVQSLSWVLRGVLESVRLKVAFAAPRRWPEISVKRLLHAASEAGISRHAEISFAWESDAASAFIAQDLQKQPEVPVFEPGDSFVVCDIGGATIETASFTIDSLGPLSVKLRTGGSARASTHGGYNIDIEFMGSVISSSSTPPSSSIVNQLYEFISYPEWRDLKHSFTGLGETTYSLSAVPTQAKKPAQVFNNRNVVLQTRDIQEFFEPTLRDVISLLAERRLKVENSTGKPPKAYILIGGTSQSPYLRRRIRQEFGYAVIPARRPWSAIADGVVLHLLQTEKRNQGSR